MKRSDFKVGQRFIVNEGKTGKRLYIYYIGESEWEGQYEIMKGREFAGLVNTITDDYFLLSRVILGVLQETCIPFKSLSIL